MDYKEAYETLELNPLTSTWGDVKKSVQFFKKTFEHNKKMAQSLPDGSPALTNATESYKLAQKARDQLCTEPAEYTFDIRDAILNFGPKGKAFFEKYHIYYEKMRSKYSLSRNWKLAGTPLSLLSAYLIYKANADNILLSLIVASAGLALIIDAVQDHKKANSPNLKLFHAFKKARDSK